MKIKKAVILAAGLGTRMGPITRSIPKPMLPILDKPVIHYITEEAIQSGIEEIFVVVSHKKEIIEDYFSDYENIFFIKQKELLGTAHALYQVKEFLNNEPFAVCLGDEIMVGDTPCLKQLMDTYHRFPNTIVTGLEETTLEAIRNYNQVTPGEEIHPSVFRIKEIIEKPLKPSSNITAVGRYILPPDIFEVIPSIEKRNNEFCLTDAFEILQNTGRLLGIIPTAKRYDIGNKKGWLNANTILSKFDPDYE